MSDGGDLFVSVGKTGRDTIAGLGGRDRIDLSDCRALDAFSDIRDDIHCRGADTVIKRAQGTIVVEGVKPGQLNADDFLF